MQNSAMGGVMLIVVALLVIGVCLVLIFLANLAGRRKLPMVEQAPRPQRMSPDMSPEAKRIYQESLMTPKEKENRRKAREDDYWNSINRESDLRDELTRH